MPPPSSAIPTFICIGPGRSGTSWLYEICDAHPEICITKVKETEFFDRRWAEGPSWYFAHFEHCGNEKAIGEISNHYWRCADAIPRIKSTLPMVKIIACVRNPYDRLLSRFYFRLRRGANWESLEDALIDEPDFLRHSLIAEELEAFQTAFSGSIYFLVFDHLRKDPAGLACNLYDFLGVSTSFVPQNVRKKVNPTVVPRLRVLGSLSKAIARYLRRLEMYSLLTRLKRSTKVKRLLFREPVKRARESVLTPEVREIVDPLFLPEIDRIRKLVPTFDLDWDGA